MRSCREMRSFELCWRALCGCNNKACLLVMSLPINRTRSHGLPPGGGDGSPTRAVTQAGSSHVPVMRPAPAPSPLLLRAACSAWTPDKKAQGPAKPANFPGRAGLLATLLPAREAGVSALGTSHVAPWRAPRLRAVGPAFTGLGALSSPRWRLSPRLAALGAPGSGVTAFALSGLTSVAGQRPQGLSASLCKLRLLFLHRLSSGTGCSRLLANPAAVRGAERSPHASPVLPTRSPSAWSAASPSGP